MKRPLLSVFFIFILVMIIVGCGTSSNTTLKETILGQYNYKLKVDLPFSLQAGGSLPIPENIRPFTLGMERYQGNNKFLTVDISCTRFNAQKLSANWSPDLDGSAKGMINGLSHSPGITNVMSNLTHTTISGRPARIVTVNCLKEKDPFEIKCLIVADGSSLWQVLTQYNKNDETYRRLAQQILGSITLPVSQSTPSPSAQLQVSAVTSGRVIVGDYELTSSGAGGGAIRPGIGYGAKDIALIVLKFTIKNETGNDLSDTVRINTNYPNGEVQTYTPLRSYAPGSTNNHTLMIHGLISNFTYIPGTYRVDIWAGGNKVGEYSFAVQ